MDTVLSTAGWHQGKVAPRRVVWPLRVSVSETTIPATSERSQGEKVEIFIILAALIVGAVVGLFFLVTRGTRAILGPRRRLEEGLGLEVLRRRLASGEISGEQFDQGKQALGL